jgi:hypothetical protein
MVAAFPYVLAEIGTADYWLPAIESFRHLMPKAGVMSVAQADAWAEGLPRFRGRGVFRREQLLRLRRPAGLTPRPR